MKYFVRFKEGIGLFNLSKCDHWYSILIRGIIRFIRLGDAKKLFMGSAIMVNYRFDSKEESNVLFEQY